MLHLSLLGLAALVTIIAGCGTAPSEDAQVLLARGDSALNILSFSEAARLYGEATALDPDLAEAYSRQGLALWAAQQFERAIPVLDRAIELNSEDARAYYYRGASYLSLSRFTESLPDLRNATDLGTLDPEDGRRAHHLRAVAYMNLEQYDEAISAVTEAIEMQPNNAFYYIERARLYDFTDQAAAAVADYQAFLARGGSSSELAPEARQRLEALGGEIPADTTKS